jgi:hypothetical protein
MAIGSTNSHLAKNISETIEAKWFDLLLELRDITGIDVFANRQGTWRNSPQHWQSHVATIEKSLAAYFAKYASKDKDTNTNQVRYYPRTWWGSSHDLKQQLKEQTIEIAMNYQTQDEAIEWYIRMDKMLSAYAHLKEYKYDYCVERQLKDSKERRVYAEGETRIRYFDTPIFEQLKEGIGTLAAWMKVEAPNREWSGQLPQNVLALTRA